ncbi:hypothetical protein [Tardiphaga sp.]|uniref:hypothetical protein n=1 Tax=Tardiphaga sp. TaxID=1926292 RepID=UPI00262B4D8B|nr:hypothetical protein [Tardiphaga sp.]MDB5615767.1 hypothetical protein [Tardiphaga sp.]
MTHDIPELVRKIEQAKRLIKSADPTTGERLRTFLADLERQLIEIDSRLGK